MPKFFVLNPSNIFRSKRRTLALYVDPMGQLIVKSPLNLSERKIFDFVKSKETWIKARMHQVLKNSHINRNVASYNSFFFLGQELLPVISKHVKEVTKGDKVLLIPAKIEQSKILKRIEKWLKIQAQTIVCERAMYFSQKLRLDVFQVITNNNKSRWGSCSRSGVIALNWRTVFLEPELLDYIIVHEFCHLLEFNHTQNFWEIVQTILPDWKKTRQHLKQMNWLLQLFRPN